MIALGIDPDVHDLSIAAWNDHGPMAAQVVHVKQRKGAYVQSQVRMAERLAGTDPDHPMWGAPVGRIAIEGQQIDGRRARPKDLFTLAHVSGAALAWCMEWFGSAAMFLPTPAEWKGAVAKHAMQARLYSDLGWGYTIHGAGTDRYARPAEAPKNFQHVTRGQWKHVGDALLLARWAHEKVA